MIGEMIPSQRDNPSAFTNGERNIDNLSYEQDTYNEEMDIISLDEDMGLYTDEQTTSWRISILAHKKETTLKRKKDFSSPKQKR